MRALDKKMERRVKKLEKRLAALEEKYQDGLSGSTLILGACDIDEIVSVIEKRLTARRLESENRS